MERLLANLSRAGALSPFAGSSGAGVALPMAVPVFQANNDILAFLSGMPVTRNTKYLDLKNSVSARPSHPPSSALWRAPDFRSQHAALCFSMEPEVPG